MVLRYSQSVSTREKAMVTVLVRSHPHLDFVPRQNMMHRGDAENAARKPRDSMLLDDSGRQHLGLLFHRNTWENLVLLLGAQPGQRAPLKKKFMSTPCRGESENQRTTPTSVRVGATKKIQEVAIGFKRHGGCNGMGHGTRISTGSPARNCWSEAKRHAAKRQVVVRFMKRRLKGRATGFFTCATSTSSSLIESCGVESIVVVETR